MWICCNIFVQLENIQFKTMVPKILKRKCIELHKYSSICLNNNLTTLEKKIRFPANKLGLHGNIKIYMEEVIFSWIMLLFCCIILRLTYVHTQTTYKKYGMVRLLLKKKLLSIISTISIIMIFILEECIFYNFYNFYTLILWRLLLKKKYFL